MRGRLDLAPAWDTHSQGAVLPRARPRVPARRPPAHMTQRTLSGTFRGSPGQPGTFQPACLQGRGRVHRLAAVPGPPLEAHEATTRPHPVLEAAEPSLPAWNVGVLPPVRGTSGPL